MSDMQAGLRALFDPRTVAVVGASDRIGSFGGECIDNLLAHGYHHTVVAVHPKYEKVRGVDCVPDLASFDGDLDVVVLAIGVDRVIDSLHQAIDAGAKAIIVLASGFGDGGPEGLALEAELTRIARAAGVPLIGPNCLGVMNRHTGATLWGTYMKRLGHPGAVSVIAQSGSVAQMLSIDDRGLGLSHIISSGNESVVSSADLIRYLAHDPSTEVILLFLETIQDPAAFAEATSVARRNGKRLAVLRNGRSAGGCEMIAGHTGGLAGDDDVYSAFFERLGIPRFNDIDTLLEAGAYLLAFPEPPTRPGVGIMTLSGGEAGLAADLADDAGLELPPYSEEGASRLDALLPPFRSPGNPMDGITLGFDVDGVRTIWDSMGHDTAFGTVAMVFGAPAAGGHDDSFVLDVIADGELTHPDSDTRAVLINTVAALGRNTELDHRASEIGGVMLHGLGPALEVLQKCSAVASVAGPHRDSSELDGLGRWNSLDEAARFDLARQAQVPMVECRVVADAAAAQTAREEWGSAIVLKGCAPSLVHKTEHGLVKVGLATAAAVDEAFEDIASTLTELGLEGTHVVAQPMAADGVELIVGVRNEPGFGPMLVVGPGGVLVNLIGEADIVAAPLSEARADQLLTAGRLGQLLDGYRGAGPFDRAAAKSALLAMSDLAVAARHHLTYAEINPLIVHPHGASAVDIALSLRDTPPATHHNPEEDHG